MLDFIEGVINSVEASYIVIYTNGIGFRVYTPNPYVFKEEESVKVYLYNLVKEDEYSLYGFKTKEERELFLKLINVKGLGPKIALPMLATGSVNGIIDAIDRENIIYLTKFPKVGDKLARQIILDLKGKLSIESTPNNLKELEETLKALGYKSSDINKVLPKITETEIEKQLKEALKLLLKWGIYENRNRYRWHNY